MSIHLWLEAPHHLCCSAWLGVLNNGEGHTSSGELRSHFSLTITAGVAGGNALGQGGSDQELNATR